MKLLEELKNDAAGLKTLTDWLGEGLHPVSQALADHRSLACVSGNNGEPCPHNKAPRWWEKAKDSIAEHMRRQVEIQNQLEITTPFQDSLHVCELCGCCMRLKVHVPMKHIKAHTPEGRFERMPPFCWQRIEAENNS